VEFPQSVAVNQQRLMTNAYYPLELEDMEKVYRSCF
jgi:4-hydroxybutyrate dehydrogenase